MSTEGPANVCERSASVHMTEARTLSGTALSNNNRLLYMRSDPFDSSTNNDILWWM
jgi:hypothetical protein